MVFAVHSNIFLVRKFRRLYNVHTIEEEADTSYICQVNEKFVAKMDKIGAREALTALKNVSIFCKGIVD